MTLKFDGWPRKIHRAPLLYYVKLCASFQIHLWIQTEVKVRKRSIPVKIGDFFVLWDLDGWPWKTIGHLFYTMSRFVHHFTAMDEFKLELQSRNFQFGSKSIFFPGRPWNLTDELEQGKSEGFDSCDWPSNLKLDSNCRFFCLCDLEIWWMTSNESCDWPIVRKSPIWV